jgi:hypothetical protein
LKKGFEKSKKHPNQDGKHESFAILIYHCCHAKTRNKQLLSILLYLLDIPLALFNNDCVLVFKWYSPVGVKPFCFAKTPCG